MTHTSNESGKIGMPIGMPLTVATSIEGEDPLAGAVVTHSYFVEHVFESQWKCTSLLEV